MSYQLDDADEDDLNKIVKDFHTYGVSQESIDKLMEMAEEFGISDSFEEDDDDGEDDDE